MNVHTRVLAPTIAMLVSIFVAAMDVAIMSTVMPTIVGQLGGLPLYSWSFAAYLLTSTTTLPLYGKLADLYGRKPIFLLGMGLFVLGSFLAGAATTMEQLIVFRAVQGLGASGTLPIAITIAGDLFPLEQRAKIQGVISSVWGVAAVLGPLIGSAIVAQTTWRWVFWINLPIGLLTATVLAATLRERVHRRSHQIDYLGAALLTAGVTALLLALVEGGQRGFHTPAVGGLLVTAALLLVLFVENERRAPEPMVPLSLLRQRLLGLTSLCGLVLGGCIYSASTYVPLFVQGVLGGSPQDVAWASATISVAWTLGSLLGSRLLLRTGFRAAALLGMALISLGAGVLVRLTSASLLGEVLVAGALLGLGLGVSATAFIVVVQTAVGWDQRGIATATHQFFRSIGGTIWVSVQGAALSATTAAGLAAAGLQLPGGRALQLGELSTVLEPASRALLQPHAARQLAEVLGAGLHQVFLLYLVLALAGLLGAGFLPAGRMAELAQSKEATSLTDS
jgi:EmrB/QacA subfamily drug resistance transporter